MLHAVKLRQFFALQGGEAEAVGVGGEDGERVFAVGFDGFDACLLEGFAHGHAFILVGDVAFANHRQRGVAEDGDVCLADGAFAGHDGQDVFVKHVHVGLDVGGLQAGRTGQHHVETGGKHRTHFFGGQDVADGTDVGADEAAVEVLRGFDERLVEFALGIDEGAVFVPADADGEAVNRLAGFGGGEQYGEAFFDARLGAVGNGDGFATGDGGDVGRGGVFAVEGDGGSMGAAGDEQGEQGFFYGDSLLC